MNPLNFFPGRIQDEASAASAEATPEVSPNELPGTPSLDYSRGNHIPDALQGRLITPTVRQPELPQGQMAFSGQSAQAPGRDHQPAIGTKEAQANPPPGGGRSGAAESL